MNQSVRLSLPQVLAEKYTPSWDMMWLEVHPVPRPLASRSGQMAACEGVMRQEMRNSVRAFLEGHGVGPGVEDGAAVWFPIVVDWFLLVQNVF